MGIRSQNYTNPAASYTDVFSSTGLDAATEPAPPPEGINASGGIVSDWVDGSDYYRTHIFTTSGTFEVDSLSTDPSLPDNVEYVVIGGGGGGGYNVGGGGGAGGMRHNTPLLPAPTRAPTYTLSTGTYVVTVGGGGGGATAANSFDTDLAFGTGGDSNFYPQPATFPSSAYIRAHGGGGHLAAPGGSGSGTHDNNPSGSGSRIDDPNHPADQGNPGGSPAFSVSTRASGGGGFGSGGLSPSGGGHGGSGIQIPQNFWGSPNMTMGHPGSSGTGWFCGGGGGGGRGNPGGTGGGPGGPYAGAGDGGSPGPRATDAKSLSGSGGGGGHYPNNADGRHGGSGLIGIRYRIAENQTNLTAPGASPKSATGGAISIHNGKVIHTFVTTGTFSAPASFSETVDYFIIAAGGGGGALSGGGGGAGGFKTGTTPMSGPFGYTFTIGAGGRGGSNNNGGVVDSQQGTASTIGTPSPITTVGGGLGGNYPGSAGGPGGSGGGAGGQTPSSAGSGTAGPPRQGYDGGAGFDAGAHSGGGGGGAGGVGQAGGPPGSGTTDGAGGIGITIPTTFYTESSTIGAPGPSPGRWVGGGGGGGSGHNTVRPQGGGAPGPGGIPYAGGGAGGNGAGLGPPWADNGDGDAISGQDGLETTGGGGGGGRYTNAATGGAGGHGGSGLIMIAYPV